MKTTWFVFVLAALLVDGVMGQTSTPAGPVQGARNPLEEGLVFNIIEWDGATLPDKATAPQKMKRDLLELVNGDKVTGTLSAIAGEKLSFKTSYASIEVPMQRVASITMSDETAERARRNRHDVRIHLADGGSITLDLKSLSERRITGSGEGYGQVTVSLDSVARLDFNIYDEQEGKAEDSW